MATSLLTLDGAGIVTDPYQKIQLILAYLLATQASQSNIFKSHVVSISDIIRRKGSQSIDMRTEVEDSIKRVFNRYFDNVDINVSIDKSNKVDKSEFDVVIQCQVTQDGKTYDVARTLSVLNDKIKLVSEFNV